jgi:hypothetical protein
MVTKSKVLKSTMKKTDTVLSITAETEEDAFLNMRNTI